MKVSVKADDRQTFERRWGKSLLLVLLLLPLAWLFVAIARDQVGPDPGEVLVHYTGIWALRLLLLTLAISPLRYWLKLPGLLRYRRMLGVASFSYASLHLLAVATLILGWDVRVLLSELAERPYMTVGFAAWVLMLPLALTSSNTMVRLLKSRWSLLHKLVYPAAVLASLHLLWQVRSDYGQALLYISVLFILLIWRFQRHFFPCKRV